jgi:hypothetical protein
MNELSTKASILQHIFEAKQAHKEWVKRADRLVNGLNGYKGKTYLNNVDESYIPLDSSSCQFGQWFNKHIQYLQKLDKIGRFVERIEEHHNQIHETYHEIYIIFFILPKKRSFLKKIFTFTQNKVSDEDREKAQIHLKYLKRSSKELLEVLNVLEDKVKSIEYTELKTLFLDT